MLTLCSMFGMVYKWHPCRTDFSGATTNFSSLCTSTVVRTPVDGSVTLKHSRWDRSTPGAVVGLTYVCRHHTMAIFIRDDKRGVDLSRDVHDFPEPPRLPRRHFVLVTIYPLTIIVVGV